MMVVDTDGDAKDLYELFELLLRCDEAVVVSLCLGLCRGVEGLFVLVLLAKRFLMSAFPAAPPTSISVDLLFVVLRV